VADDAVPLLVYDGDCMFGSSVAGWVAAQWDGRPRAVPWQRLAPAQLDAIGLSAADMRAAAWWVDARGRHRGHLAIARALVAAGGWPGALGQVLLVPPFRSLGAAAYPVIARWRHRLPGGTPSCGS
jgi:predicted DCC family thiol-disulfide oxidoreductase YuxK